MQQRTFFDAPGRSPTPIAPASPAEPSAPHVAGSETSRQAAEGIEAHVGRLQELVLEYIKGCGPSGATDEQISLGLGLHTDTTRPRRVELRNLGLVRDSGQRRKTSSGRQATVWVAADAGGEEAWR